MKTWVRRSLNVGVLGAGFLLVSGTAAQADQVSGPNAGIASGNQLSSVLQLPIDISGNAVSVLGFADAASVGGAGAVNTESAPVTEAGQVSGFNSGILSGNQVSSVVQVPVSVCGNSVAVLGFANASCVGGAGAVNGGGGWSNGGWDNDGDGQGNGGYGQGNGGYSGDDDADADGGYGQGGGRSNYYDEHGRNRGMGAGARNMGGGGALSNGGADQVTGYNAGLLSGNQVSSVIQAPIDVSGNAIALFGFASASSVGGAGAKNESAAATEAGQVSGFNAGVLTGNQLSSVVQVPISVCGNSIAILGFADASCVGGAGAVNGGGGGWDNDRDWDDNDDGGADPAGNYYADPSGGRPMSSGHGAHGASKAAKKAAKKAKHGNEHGNWGGRGHNGNGHGAGASNDGYGGTGSGGYNGGGSGSGNGGNGNGGNWGGGGSCGPDQVTGFNSGILSGNQVSNVVQLPIDISGNAISVLGFASASSVGGAAAVNC
jgi:hypothetical protein